jgi:hypothetical protein
MKKLIVILFLAIFCIAGFSQTSKNSFFKPVSKGLFGAPGAKAVNPSVWLLRPTVEISAVQLIWNNETKQFDSRAFSSTGLGIGYQHYIEVDGVPYNNYGFNALLLFGASTDTGPASMSLAATVSALKFVNIGVGYNFAQKSVLLLTGVTYNF